MKSGGLGGRLIMGRLFGSGVWQEHVFYFCQPSYICFSQ